MSTANEIKVVLVQELSDHISSKSVGHATVILTPPSNLPVWIRPQEITKQSLVRHVNWPLYHPYPIQIIQVRRQPSMHAEYLIIYHCCHRQAIKTISKKLPQTHTEPALALVIKPVNSIDGGTFMVASEKEEVIRELDFVSQEQADCLNALLATIDIVPEEQIV